MLRAADEDDPLEEPAARRFFLSCKRSDYGPLQMAFETTGPSSWPAPILIGLDGASLALPAVPLTVTVLRKPWQAAERSGAHSSSAVQWQ